MIEHYYHMRQYYDNKKLPVTGAFLVGAEYTANEYDSNSTLFSDKIPKIPGGFFYIEYIVYYFLSGENLYIARILYGVAMSLFSCIFLLWIYKKFEVKIFAIMTSLIFVNITFFTVTNRFYNPHTVFILSYISIPIILEYITSKKLNFIYAILIFPIIALEAMGHIAAFFSIVPTLIVYFIIRWKITKKYIIPISIGIFISFLLYVPYLISEINNGFQNFNNVIELKNQAKHILQPPQIWSILFFPTNESNANYGNTISAIFSPWFNGDIKLIFSFIFYIASVLIGISSFIILLKDFFQHKLECDNNLIFKETALIYFLYIIVTVAVFMIFNLGAARARYFFNIYPLTFIPIIYLIKKIENKKIFNVFLIFILLNPLAVYIETKYIIYKTSDNEGWNFMVNHIEAINEDISNSQFYTFDLSANNDYPYILFKIENKNFYIDTNAKIKYNIIPSFDKNFNHSNMEMIYSNKQYITYKEFKTNIN
ncbi:hypothetical protein R4K54_06215 [Brachyspira murdochii]